MDNALLIVGGRNIGNHYFGVDDKINFRDLDIVAAGPIVREVSDVYDYFWNGEWSVPVKVMTKKIYTQNELKDARAILTQKIAKDRYPYPLSSDVRKVRSQMHSIRDNLVWTKGKFVWDDPKQMKLSADKQHGTMIEKLRTKVKTLKQSLTIESPYFIPGDYGTALLKAMHKRGVNIRILTNSQSSNDVMAAFAGYATYRKELVEGGIKMHELRPDAGGNLIINKQTKLGSVTSGLHAKALVFDEKTVFVGSFNLDPRSATINTEGGLYVESPVIAKRVLRYMNEGAKPQNSYRVELDKNGDLIWMSETNGKEEVYHTDPHTSGWDRMKANIIQALPLEKQL